MFAPDEVAWLQFHGLARAQGWYALPSSSSSSERTVLVFDPKYFEAQSAPLVVTGAVAEFQLSQVVKSGEAARQFRFCAGPITPDTSEAVLGLSRVPPFWVSSKPHFHRENRAAFFHQTFERGAYGEESFNPFVVSTEQACHPVLLQHATLCALFEVHKTRGSRGKKKEEAQTAPVELDPATATKRPASSSPAPIPHRMAVQPKPHGSMWARQGWADRFGEEDGDRFGPDAVRPTVLPPPPLRKQQRTESGAKPAPTRAPWAKGGAPPPQPRGRREVPQHSENVLAFAAERAAGQHPSRHGGKVPRGGVPPPPPSLRDKSAFFAILDDSSVGSLTYASSFTPEVRDLHNSTAGMTTAEHAWETKRLRAFCRVVNQAENPILPPWSAHLSPDQPCVFYTPTSRSGSATQVAHFTHLSPDRPCSIYVPRSGCPTPIGLFRSPTPALHYAYVADATPVQYEYAHLSVALRPGEVVYDPGATSELGSTPAWLELDLAMKERYGVGFDTGQAAVSFHVADGRTSSGSHGFSASFEIPRLGTFTLAGIGMDCGSQSSRQTPILFGCRSCRALKFVTDHEEATVYSKLFGVGVSCRRAPSGHLLLPIFDLLDKAGARPLPKNG